MTMHILMLTLLNKYSQNKKKSITRRINKLYNTKAKVNTVEIYTHINIVQDRCNNVRSTNCELLYPRDPRRHELLHLEIDSALFSSSTYVRCKTFTCRGLLIKETEFSGVL